MVSVVIPCFNHAQYVEETVQSVLASSFKAVEVIIVDDGSVDNSREVCENICARFEAVTYIYQDNAGPSVARNTGISKAKGRYILALDADDLISPNYLEEAVKILEKHADVKVVYAEAEKFGSVAAKWKLKKYSSCRLAKDNMIYVSAVYRRADWERIGGYTDESVLVREDWEFWIKMLKDGGDVFCLPFVGFYYRIHQKSRRKSMSPAKKKAEIDYLNSVHPDFFRAQLGGPLRKTRSWSRFINFFARG